MGMDRMGLVFFLGGGEIYSRSWKNACLEWGQKLLGEMFVNICSKELEPTNSKDATLGSMID